MQLAFDKPPSLAEWADYVSTLCEQLNRKGVFNLLLSDGDALMTFCSTKLCWITRRAPFGKAHLSDEDMTVDFSAVTTENDIVTVIATDPLTDDERWHPMQPGECRVFLEGETAWQKTTGAIAHPKQNNAL